MTTARARLGTRRKRYVCVRVQNTSKKFVHACTQGEGRSCIIRSSWARTRVPVAPGTGQQKRLNVPICPVRSPEAIHPRLPFVRPRVPGCSSSLSAVYTNDITVSPKFPLPPTPETVTRKIINEPGLAARSLFVVVPNEFILVSQGDVSACFRHVFFLKDPSKPVCETLQLKSVYHILG